MAVDRCKSCAGSGKLRGSGMIMQDCHYCGGSGSINIIELSDIKIDKESKQYKEAIKKIKGLNTSITDEKAHVIFSDALKQIDKDIDKNECNKNTD